MSSGSNDELCHPTGGWRSNVRGACRDTEYAGRRNLHGVEGEGGVQPSIDGVLALLNSTQPGDDGDHNDDDDDSFAVVANTSTSTEVWFWVE